MADDRYTDYIGEIPENPILGPTARGLAALKRGLNYVDLADLATAGRGIPPLPKVAGSEQGVGDLLLGSAPEEMDKWAHGFSPFYDQSGGFNPTLRPDRVAGVLAAATLPIRELTVPAKLAGRGAQQIVEDLAERKLNLAKFMEEAHPALKDEAGNPHVFYTGTSKDKDFTSFNTERHGSWFTRDPEEASMYAKENDSMGYKYQHGNFERTNTASRVIPVYLSSKNPYTGPKPEEIFRARNYKKAQSDWFDSLKKAGYDSWIPEDTPGLAVMFHRNQIKSAIGNRGTYDIAQKEMNKAHGGSIENTTHDRKLI